MNNTKHNDEFSAELAWTVCTFDQNDIRIKKADTGI